MNHCIIEVKVKTAPVIRYTQENQTAIAEMEVLFESLRADEAPGELKVVGWGNIAQEMQSQIKEGQRINLEGRLRMNTLTRQDGLKEKKAELTLSKFHPTSEHTSSSPNVANKEEGVLETSQKSQKSNFVNNENSISTEEESIKWNSSPLVPDTDDIPF